jgi:cob(I)alamin adenosyltransferase
MNTPQLYQKESEDLETHVSLCHQRYIQLDARLRKLEQDVFQIHQDIASGNRSLKKSIITSTATILAAMISLVATILIEK